MGLLNFVRRLIEPRSRWGRSAANKQAGKDLSKTLAEADEIHIGGGGGASGGGITGSAVYRMLEEGTSADQ